MKMYMKAIQAELSGIYMSLIPAQGEIEADRTLSSRPTQSTRLAPGQPDLYNETQPKVGEGANYPMSNFRTNF